MTDMRAELGIWMEKVETILVDRGVLDENGQEAMPDKPKIRGDLRNQLSKEQIEIIRHGL